MKFTAVLEIAPTPKQSTKFIRATGRSYTPKKQRLYEKRLLDILEKALPDATMIETAAYLTITFCMKKPKKLKRERPAVRPDLTNLIKPVEDSLQRAGLIKDDSLITSTIARKIYSDAYPDGAVIVTLEAAE